VDAPVLAGIAGGRSRPLAPGLVNGRPARSERALVRDARRGSHEALEDLFRANWPVAYRAAFLIVHEHAAAEDIAQEAILAAIRSLDRFDRRRPLRP
jgi:RNA polymerase sigma-70 factor (ECF subfamily)